jgi:hypothetical protein
MGHEPKPDQCDNCWWKTDDLQEFDAYARTVGHGPFTPDADKAWAWLCEVCRSTRAGNAYQYPRQYEDGDVMALTAWGINRVLAEIRRSVSAASDA